jgi:hypothetical protein
MTPRRRSDEGHGLPPNTHVNRTGGRVYYQWTHPATRRRRSLGPDRAAAIAEAERRNLEVREQYGSEHRARIFAQGADLNTGRILDGFWHEYVPRQDWSDRYRDEMRILRDRYMRELGRYTLLGVSRKVLQSLWTGLGPHAYHRHRVFWIHLFRYAMSQNRTIQQNEAEHTLTAPSRQRRRGRLTLEQFQAIREHAPRDLQIAMDVALYSLQRRGDLVRMLREDVDRSAEPWVLRVAPRKVRKLEVRLRIQAPAGSKLRGALEAALRLPAELGVVTPALLAHQPRRQRQARERVHVYAWTEGALSRAFQAARDATGLWEDVPAEERPTFHSLRALGAWLYREAGFSEEQVQAIAGHQSSDMTRAYQDGHGEVWQDVEAGL